jgi:hypothetical protein
VTDTPDDDDRPWEQPGAVRRDCEPHRGDVLLSFGRVSLVVGLLGFVLGLTTLVALPLGVVIDVLAWRDLRRIRAGEMDPRGEGTVRRAQRVAEWAIALNVAAALLWLVVFGGLLSHGWMPVVFGVGVLGLGLIAAVVTPLVDGKRG